MRKQLLALALGVAPVALAQTNPFDPKAYIDSQEVKAPPPTEEHILLSRGIYKIEGHRYQKFLSNRGAVYLPSPNAIPDTLEATVLCPVHIRYIREVLPIRDGLAIDKDLKPVEKEILRLVDLCSDGGIKGPTRIFEQDDGTTVEVEAKGKPGKDPGSSKKDVITK